MKKSVFLPLVIALGLASQALAATYVTVNNDAWSKDQSGHPLYTQGGGIVLHNGVYYFFGVEYNGAHTYYNSGTTNSDTSFLNIPCYTSTDLVHWTWISEAATPATLPGATWVGRIGTVFYNSQIGRWVLWVEYAGTKGTGMACLTSQSLTSTFTFQKVQTSITNVFDNVQGDSTAFVDLDHGSTPYFICSDAHGRQHAYVSTFSADGQTINPAVLLTEWPQGQEADCMFEYNNRYYFCTSQLAGWSYSHAYQINGTAIQTPSSYTADADFNGTDSTHTYWSQISEFVHLTSGSTALIVAVGDRWADFSSNYKNAGHGSNYFIMCPLSFSGTTPTFNALATWQLSASTAQWTH